MQNNYVKELKNGKQIRIKYNKFIHDWVDDNSGWMEELWCYDNKLDLFKCYFHMFESSGEHAWKMLGLTNAIVSESELDELENKLRDRLLILLTQEKENK